MSGKKKNIGIIGYGTVGSGVYETLQHKREKIEKLIDGAFNISVVLVKNSHKERNIGLDTDVTNSFETFIQKGLDTVVEASPDAETAYPYVKQLLQKGITVVTANKELVAKHGEELLNLADTNDCRLYYEAAVAGGIPILTSLRHTLKTNDVEQVEGIVNGTSNFILTKMREEGTAFQDALKEAQENGYAEAVPDKDIDGWDAFYKTTILSHWIYGKAPSWSHDKPQGVRGIDTRDLLIASEFSGRIKHIASLEKVSSKVIASVRPRFVLNTHPLYGVEGVNNGIHVKGNIVGSLLFQGAGAGKFPTASAVVEELINDWTKTSEKNPFRSSRETEQRIVREDQLQEYETGEGSSLWLITGKELGLQLENQNVVEKVTQIKKIEGREAVIAKGVENKVIEVMSALNDTVSFYPVSGNENEIRLLSYAKNRSAS
ncbi:homoserine dehydrogenase [Salipaludibacillus daqingensis]|uniref:homoserine dehydrogenase n=1 Tax=Salipaludibacillus daqingensis TaxID=3041001 RepID=UPI002474DF44|nr:homoserine dehydrogenase [Salipaludibacillus daqingensis]